MWRCSVLMLLALLVSCERYPTGGDLRIRRDMASQPSFRAQEDPRPLADGAVSGDFEAPVAKADAEKVLINPTSATPKSVEQGEKLFRIYCTPCHGAAARGDGPVASKMAKVANLNDEKYLKAADGFFYYTIRYGTEIMPSQAENLAPAERWHVVNYIRKLQRK
jgi:mono/diheme cytochrome c family protein